MGVRHKEYPVVLIVEESAYQRKHFSEMLSSQKNIEVIDAVKSEAEAKFFIKFNLDILSWDLYLNVYFRKFYK